ncbi:Acyl-CoA dehydrogenase, short-chain specific [Roseovarius gaetbuli]|uniref:Acyl-CoA dehydrogenase, short-chain specific n=1 Tax=Roseovarius gaetbuli TaxID=1356575 RepID=A0A1X7ABS8_9RHOB|nr:acyl-CoA dehydrogenase family protein [Roseovarius gaetbuli]SLN75085.1 Acyl-CoA dehydrogenase, short-chain specific [Roseovarius gaetbuli]
MTQAFLDRVTSFAADHLTPAAADWSMGETPDTAIYEMAGQIGILGMQVPQSFGGQGLDFATRAAACSILAGADFGFAMSLVNTHNIALRLSEIAPDAMCQRYIPDLLSGKISACTALTEPSTGSDFAAVTTQAIQADTGWVLNGEKTWIINGRHAGLSIVYAQCRSIGDSKGIGAFLVDLNAKGVMRYAIDGGFAQTSMGTGGFSLQDVEVAHDAMLIAPGTAFKAILTEINGARTYVAAMCNGMVGQAIADVAAYGRHRDSFGKPLNAIPSWQAALSAAEAALNSSQTLTARAIDLVNTASDAQLAAAQAKIEAVTCAQRYLPELLHLMGAEGLRPERPFARHIAAAQIAGFTDGATNILKDRVARLTAQKGP